MPPKWVDFLYQDAIWFYAWKRDNRCSVYSSQNARGIKGKKLYMCFADFEKAFDRVTRKVMEWAMRKKVPEAMVKAVMRQHNGAKREVKVG